MCTRQRCLDQANQVCNQVKSSQHKSRRTHLLGALVKEGKAGVLVRHKGALLNEAEEHLRLHHLSVELGVSLVSALQEPCTDTQALYTQG